MSKVRTPPKVKGKIREGTWLLRDKFGRTTTHYCETGLLAHDFERTDRRGKNNDLRARVVVSGAPTTVIGVFVAGIFYIYAVDADGDRTWA